MNKKTIVVTPCGPDLKVLSKIIERHSSSLIISIGGIEVKSTQNGILNTVKIKTFGGQEAVSEITFSQDIWIEIFETSPNQIHDTITDDANKILDIINAHTQSDIIVNVNGGDIADNLICNWVAKTVPFKRHLRTLAYIQDDFQDVPRFKRRKKSEGLWESKKIDSVIEHFLRLEKGNHHYYSLESVEMKDGTRILFFRREIIAKIDMDKNLFFLDIHKNAPLRMSFRVRGMADKFGIPHNKLKES